MTAATDGKMPKNEIAFPLGRATDSLWNRKVVSFSAVVCDDSGALLLL